MTPLIVVLFTGIILMTGLSIDLMRHESARADLQAALDRGVLAATALNQTIDAETVINDYLDARIQNTIPVDVVVTSSGAGNGRFVSADASFYLESMFLQIADLDQIRVPAFSAARQSYTNVEISLVLDMSSSMKTTSNGLARIERLQPAAVEFVSTMLGTGGADYTTITLVPYSGETNPGPFMFNLLGGVSSYPGTKCLDFIDAAEFAGTGLPGAGSYPQVPLFNMWSVGGFVDWGWCPGTGNEITYLSNDATALNTTINNLRLHGGTGTYYGMKWGLALLDPTSQWAVQELATAGFVQPEFANRPAAWNDGDTLKVIVLMTDGRINPQYRPVDPDDPRHATERSSTSTGATHYAPVVMPRTTGRGYFDDLCQMAKDNGVEIFTISFEATSSGQTEMQNCASDPKIDHYFDVQGIAISTAFQNIAAQLARLKLVQ